jgi:hypothetical protein
VLPGSGAKLKSIWKPEMEPLICEDVSVNCTLEVWSVLKRNSTVSDAGNLQEPVLYRNKRQ